MILYNETNDTLLKSYSQVPTGQAYSKDSVFKYSVPTKDVSVIIPCYNSENYIRECLNSILEQNSKYDYEVIAINDGSTDCTAEILDEYAAKYPQLKVISQRNRGFSGARNTGISESRGQYLMFVDSDDYVSPNYINALIDKIIADEADVEACGFFSFRGNHKYKNVNPQNEADKRMLNGCFWAKAFKRELFSHIVFPEGYWYEDSILAHLIYPSVKKYGSTDACQYGYRSNPTGITISSNGKPKSLDTFYITDLMIESVVKQFGKDYILKQKYYELLIEQFYLNQRRISLLPIKYREFVFRKQSELIRHIYEKYQCNSFVNKKYEKALKKNDFERGEQVVKNFYIYVAIGKLLERKESYESN